MTCDACGAIDQFCAPIAVILVFAPGLPEPYPLIPAEHYRACTACDAIVTLVTRAVQAHPATRTAGRWTRAVVVSIDGEGVDCYATAHAEKWAC